MHIAYSAGYLFRSHIATIPSRVITGQSSYHPQSVLLSPQLENFMLEVCFVSLDTRLYIPKGAKALEKSENALKVRYVGT